MQRCLLGVRALGRESVQFDHEGVRNIQFNLRVAILETFGPNSPEFGEYSDYLIYSRGPRSVPSVGIRNIPQRESARFIRELPQTESMLNGLINRLDQKRAEFIMRAEPQATVAFENLRLHPLIANACTGLYRDGHYRQAILDGSIALVNLVKDRSGRNDLDGADLMRKVFSRKSPALAFNALRDRRRTRGDHAPVRRRSVGS